MWLWAGVPERKLTFVAYKGSKTDKTGHAVHAKHSWSYTVLLITFVWRDAEAQEHLFLLTLIVTKLVLAQLQVQDVDKIGKEIKYKKTGNIVRNRNSWGGLQKFDLAVDWQEFESWVLGDDSNSTKCLQPVGKHCRGQITCKFYAEVKRQATMSENTKHQALGIFSFKNTAVNW